MYDGTYWRFCWTAGGYVVVNGNDVYAYPIWGSAGELFSRWREHDLRIPLGGMFKLRLRNGEPA